MNYIALVGNVPEKAVETLELLPEIIKVFRLAPDILIDTPICNHPDTILCIYNGKLYCHSTYAEKNSLLLSEICRMGSLSLCAQNGVRNGLYPNDCAFNALTVGNTLIGRKKSLCHPLSDICVNTNQGYAACCGLYAGDTVITADPSLISVFRKHGIPYYGVSGKGIDLPGYNTGFIGGTGGFFENKICVFGSPELSESGFELSEFCKIKKIDLISLCGGKITDYGGIKFIPIS